MNTNGYTDFDSQISDAEAGFEGPEVILSNKLSSHSQLQLQVLVGA